MSRRRAFALAVLAVTAGAAANAAAWSPSADMDAAPSGRIAFSDRIIGKVDAYRIVVVNAQGVRRVLPLAPGHSFTPAWSPDATKIAFVSAGYNYERPEVWVMNADGTGQRRLTRKGDEPAWSPDGLSIAFSRGRDIHVMSPDGSGERMLTRNGYSPAWSPDGGSIAFVRTGEIFVMFADGTEQRRLTRSRLPEFNPDWSPTGTKIAFDRAERVYVMNADASRQHFIALGYDPSWSPDATRIAYNSQPRGLSNQGIYTINADGSRRRYVGGFDQSGGAAWSRR